MQVPLHSKRTFVFPVEGLTRSTESSFPTNTMELPDGDHAGSDSHSFVCVSWRSPEPSAFIVKRSDTSRCERKKASFEPSGDQAGSRSEYLPLVSWVRCEPSGSIVKIA